MVRIELNNEPLMLTAMCIIRKYFNHFARASHLNINRRCEEKHERYSLLIKNNDCIQQTVQSLWIQRFWIQETIGSMRPWVDGGDIFVYRKASFLLLSISGHGALYRHPREGGDPARGWSRPPGVSYHSCIVNRFLPFESQYRKSSPPFRLAG